MADGDGRKHGEDAPQHEPAHDGAFSFDDDADYGEPLTGEGAYESARAEAGAIDDQPGFAVPHGERLALGDEERLPWLDSADDVDERDKPDTGRLVGFLGVCALVLAALIGLLYWLTHHNKTADVADGTLIEASPGPYKVEPSAAGGKTFEGTGDSSFKVSQGESVTGKVAPTPTTSPSPAPSASASATPAPALPAGGGVAVQVGAYRSREMAETQWTQLSGQYEALKGKPHRVVEGQADIGTVFRLQALTGDPASATALCGSLESAGLHCQVKR